MREDSKGYFLQVSDDCLGHYRFKVKDELIKIFYSIKGNWTSKYKGKKALEVFDNGNGDINFKFFGGKDVTLNLSELAEMQLALKLLGPKVSCKYEKVIK